MKKYMIDRKRKVVTFHAQNGGITFAFDVTFEEIKRIWREVG